jgi:hypothetical protein
MGIYGSLPIDHLQVKAGLYSHGAEEHVLLGIYICVLYLVNVDDSYEKRQISCNAPGGCYCDNCGVRGMSSNTPKTKYASLTMGGL